MSGYGVTSEPVAPWCRTVAHVDARVRAAHDVVQNLVHALAGRLVRGTQHRQDLRARGAKGAEQGERAVPQSGGRPSLPLSLTHLEQLDLNPWGGHAVVVKVAGQPVLRDLLQHGDEAGDEVLERVGVLLLHVRAWRGGEVTAKGAAAGAGPRTLAWSRSTFRVAPITAGSLSHSVRRKCSPRWETELSSSCRQRCRAMTAFLRTISLRRRVRLGATQEKGPAAARAPLVLEQVDHDVDHGGNHVAREQLAQGHQRHRHLKVVVALHVALELVHQHEAELVLGGEQEAGSEVAWKAGAVRGAVRRRGA